MPDDWSIAESTSTWGVVNVDSTDGADPTEELRVPSSKLPWAICKCLSFNHLCVRPTTHVTCVSLRKRRINHQLYCAVP